MVSDFSYQRLKHTEAHVPNWTLRNSNAGKWNRMEMPEINLHTYKKFGNKPDEIKWGTTII